MDTGFRILLAKSRHQEDYSRYEEDDKDADDVDQHPLFILLSLVALLFVFLPRLHTTIGSHVTNLTLLFIVLALALHLCIGAALYIYFIYMFNSSGLLILALSTE